MQLQEYFFFSHVNFKKIKENKNNYIDYRASLYINKPQLLDNQLIQSLKNDILTRKHIQQPTSDFAKIQICHHVLFSHKLHLLKTY